MYVLAPIGAFGAMAYTIGQFGIGTLLSLGELMLVMIVACLFFIFVVLGTIAWWSGISLCKYIEVHQGRTPDRRWAPRHRRPCCRG